MASSKFVSTNPDLPRESSISSLTTLLSDLQPNTMDDLLKSIYTPHPQPPPSKDTPTTSSSAAATKTVDDVWKEIVSGGSHPQRGADSGGDDDDDGGDGGGGEGLEEMTLEDFLTKAGAVREEDIRGVVPSVINEGSSSVEAFGNGNGIGASSASASVGKGKRRAVEEPVDKATLQKQRRMIKNRESAARSRERKQAYTSELEYLVQQLEQENTRLINEELKEFLIPIEEKPKQKLRLQRTNSVQSL
ncbi:bZIP transcription factor 12-like isoform X2 [Gastrolobium bilobum]|uniref:bZIP transcription factor 12-like isoform X2 n=1 Tax=Gastrolobium bilobum TaxID=150636 RepID=UPI002AB105AC|nr:bZIP transcription factor 12-like isoform X2 [Gastrolobium bilobum]